MNHLQRNDDPARDPAACDPPDGLGGALGELRKMRDAWSVECERLRCSAQRLEELVDRAERMIESGSLAIASVNRPAC